MKYEGLTVAISLVALTASLGNLYYTDQSFKDAKSESQDAKKRIKILERQVSISQKNYDATLFQLELYKKAIDIESNKYNTSLKGLNVRERELEISSSKVELEENKIRLEKERLEFEKQRQKKLSDFNAIIGSNTVSQLNQPLAHLNKIDLNISNNSSFSESYDVSVRSVGFGVHWSNYQELENKLLYNINLDRGSIVVPVGKTYENSFLIVHGQNRPTKGILMIYVNNDLIRKVCYTYQQNIDAYMPNDCSNRYLY